MIAKKIKRSEQAHNHLSKAPHPLVRAQPYKQLRHSSLSSKIKQTSNKQSSSNAQPKLIPVPQYPMMMNDKAPAKLTLH